MKINRYFLVIPFLFFILINPAVAQNKEQTSLKSFLQTLEERFNVVFTYADENIEGITIKIPQQSLTLATYLDELEKQTGLTFNKLDSRYITIQKESSSENIAVSGTVIEENSEKPLVGAIIHSGQKTTLSNKNGWFSIQLNPREDITLIISYTGYKNTFITPDEWGKDPVVYALTPDIQELEEVVVNYIATGIDKLVDGSIQLNTQNLKILPGLSEPDILRTAQVLPGILSVNETVSYINTRGGTNDQTLVLWDGVKMYHTGHFFGLISGFNSHLIHKTIFIKNGTSAALGGGVSGTIDMKLQDYPVNKFKVSTGINLLSADAILEIPVTSKLSLQLGVRHSINNLIVTPTYKDYYRRVFEHTAVLPNKGSSADIDRYHDFYFYDGSLKLLYDVSEKDKIRFSFLGMKDAIEYEESALINDTLYKKMSHLSQFSLLSDFNYEHKWNKKHATRFSAYVSSYNLDGYNAELLNDQSHVQENDVLDWGIKLHSRADIGEKVSLSYGYKFDEIGIRNLDNINKPDYSRDVKDVLRIQALYSEAEFNKLFNRLYLRLGLRAIYLQKFNALLPEPRLALNFKLTDYIACEVQAEEKSQYTTQLIDYQTDFLGIEKRRWVLSNNTSIPVIKSRQLSFGIRYNRNHFLMSVEAYGKKVDGIITPGQGFQNQFQYVFGIGNYETKGIETLINKQFRNTTLWINYSVALNNYYFGELEPSSFPNNLDIRHAATLGGSYTFKNLEVSGGFNFRTGRPYTRPMQDNPGITNNIVYDTPNSSRIDNFIRLDFSAKYKFHIRKMEGQFGASVWNVLNRKNVINIYYVRSNNSIEQVDQHALGITPNVNVRLVF
ncbi:MAG TPA: TonB-dependent receptor [Bacteroidales bacterium]|nr:TonB-dependent receptor [Bacteroidales bacterium]